MLRAFRTFLDQCPVHIKVLTIFTGTFRVKGGGRFRITTFSFLTVFFGVVVALLGVFSFTVILRIAKPLPLLVPPPLLPLYPMNSPHYYSRSRKYFLHFGSLFPFLLNRLATFCS